MQAKLYFPVPDYDDSRFEYKGQLGAQQYINSLYDSYNQGNAQLSKLRTYQGANNKFMFTSSSMAMLQSSRSRQNRGVKKARDDFYKYVPVNVIIRNTQGDDESIDNLISYYQTGEPFAIIVKFPNKFSELDPDIDTELKYWAKDTAKINRAPRIHPEKKFMMLPSKNLRVEFGKDSYAVLRDVKISQKYGSWEYAFIVQEIIFTKQLDIPQELIQERKFLS